LWQNVSKALLKIARVCGREVSVIGDVPVIEDQPAGKKKSPKGAG
jgi:hypothetical protein